MSEFYPFLSFGLFIAAAIAAAVLLQRRQAKQWKEVGRRLDLSYLPGGFLSGPGTLVGTYKGVAVNASTEVRGYGKNKQRWTVITAALVPPLRCGLRISDEHLLQKVGKLLGVQDIQTGDDTFDRRFIIKGQNEHDVLRVLTPRVRSVLLDARGSVGPLMLNDHECRWERRRSWGESAEVLQSVISWQVRVAIELRRAVGETVDLSADGL